MGRVRTLLCGVSLFITTFWVPVAAAIYTPFWYDFSCSWHGRCALLEEGRPRVLVRELTSYLAHTGTLEDPDWSEKERQHLSEARARLDVATVGAVAALLFLAVSATAAQLRRCALVNLALFPLLTGVFPFFKTFWRDLFHPLLFSNNLWLNTPLDLSFYLMPRRFFFWTIAMGIACAVGINGCILLVTWRKGKGEARGRTDQTTQTGGAMKRIGWMALGLVLGILLSVGYRVVTEDGASPPSVAEAVVEKKQGAEMMNAPSGPAVQREDEGSVASNGAPPFTPDMDRLREELPGNLAIPPRDKDERWMRDEAKKSRNELFGRISSNIASDEEVHSYYDEQTLLTRDSIAMLEWILKEHEEEMGERDLARHHFLLDQFKKRLAAIPDRQARALKRMLEKQG
ncbi:DUF1461 domain-containing protein [Desulfoluna limicola]|nr:DUF1461 domain-containing protein [Desulfoluna limicola]